MTTAQACAARSGALQEVAKLLLAEPRVAHDTAHRVRVARIVPGIIRHPS